MELARKLRAANAYIEELKTDLELARDKIKALKALVRELGGKIDDDDEDLPEVPAVIAARKLRTH